MSCRLHIFLIGVGCTLATLSRAQGSFNNCSAAFSGDKMVVSEYSPKGQCQLLSTATGNLTVQTVDLSPIESKPVDKIDFKVAIRHKATGTLMMYSGDTFRQVPVQRIVATCKTDDHIVLLTMDNRYALPHNEILVQP